MKLSTSNPDLLADVGTCTHCMRPVNGSGPRGWTHTETGLYRCSHPPHEWAEPLTHDDIDVIVDDASAEAETSGFEQGRAYGFDEGVLSGQETILRDLAAALEQLIGGADHVSASELRQLVESLA